MGISLEGSSFWVPGGRAVEVRGAGLTRHPLSCHGEAEGIAGGGEEGGGGGELRPACCQLTRRSHRAAEPQRARRHFLIERERERETEREIERL